MSAHHQDILAIAPSLQGIDLNPSSESRIWAAEVTLPSSFKPGQRSLLGLDDLSRVEAELRIGNGHDLLERVRKSLGVRSFLTKRSRDRVGYRNYTRSQGEIRRAQSVVKQWGRAYRKNWAALVSLGITGPVLQGLQELKNEDLTLLSTWLEDEQYRDRAVSLPWIWRLSPLLADGKTVQDDEMAKLVASWNDEGAHLFKRASPVFVLILLPKVVRLEWIHASAGGQRWTEQLRLLVEEQNRVALTFRWSQRQWERRKTSQTPFTDARELHGWVSYCSKQAAKYAGLADEADSYVEKLAS